MRSFVMSICLFALACSGAVVAPDASAPAKAAAPDPYPSAAEVEKLAAQPVAAEPVAEQQAEVIVDSWTFAAPVPATFGAAWQPGASPWDKALVQAAAARAGFVATPQSHACAARELGRIVATRGGAKATPELQTGLAQLCGVPAGQLASHWQHGETLPNETDDAVLKRWKVDLVAFAAQSLQSGQHDAGIAWVREGKHAVLIVVDTPRLALLEATPRAADSKGRVTVRGELLGAAQSVQAMVNQGAFGVAECEMDPALALPKFAAHCPVLKTDAEATLQIAAFQPGRVLGDFVFRGLAFPGGALPTQWKQAQLAGTNADLLSQINAVRALAGRPPVQPADRQSETARRLVPHFFAALGGQEPVMNADAVALGMLAGWQVGTEVIDAHMATTRLQAPADVPHMLAALLAEPNGRVTLLHAAARWLAVGAAKTADGDIGLLVGSYVPAQSDALQKQAAALVQRIQDKRKAAGQLPAVVLEEAALPLEELAQKLRSGAVDPAGALQAALQQAVAVAQPGSSVMGWRLEADTVERMTLPPELLQTSAAKLGLTLSWYHSPGTARARLVALVLLMDSGLRTASR